MGLLEHAAYKAGRLYKEATSAPGRYVDSIKSNYTEGYEEVMPREKKSNRNIQREVLEEEDTYIKDQQTTDAQWERASGSKKIADRVWEDALGKLKTEPVKAEKFRTSPPARSQPARQPVQKPTVIHNHYSAPRSAPKGRSSGGRAPPRQKMSRGLTQPSFGQVNDRLVGASDRQVDNLDAYNEKIRRMFG